MNPSNPWSSRARARALLAALAVAPILACASDDPSPIAPPTPLPPSGSVPHVPRVLVVNTLSETLSSLDLESGEMTIAAAVVGTWTNRVVATPNGSRLLVTDSGSNEVEVLSARDFSRLTTIDVGAGRNPWISRAIDETRAYVTNWLGAEVCLLQIPTSSLARAIPVSPGPEGFCVLGGRLFVACSNFGGTPGDFGDGTVDVVSVAGARVVASIPVGRNPQDAVVGPDGRVHVLCTGDYSGIVAGRVDIIDPGALTVVGSVAIGGSPERIAAAPDGAMWVVGFAGGLRRYDAATRTALADPIDPSLSTSLSALAADPVEGKVYVTSFDDDRLFAVDATSRQVVDSWPVGDGPVDVLVLR